MQPVKPAGLDDKLGAILRILRNRAAFEEDRRELEALCERPVPKLPEFRFTVYLTDADADYLVSQLVERMHAELVDAQVVA